MLDDRPQAAPLAARACILQAQAKTRVATWGGCAVEPNSLSRRTTQPIDQSKWGKVSLGREAELALARQMGMLDSADAAESSIVNTLSGL